MATMDLLGEEVKDPAKAVANVEEYERMLAAIAERKLDANISIKPTSLGLKIDEKVCRDHVDRIAAAADDRAPGKLDDRQLGGDAAQLRVVERARPVGPPPPLAAFAAAVGLACHVASRCTLSSGRQHSAASRTTLRSGRRRGRSRPQPIPLAAAGRRAA